MKTIISFILICFSKLLISQSTVKTETFVVKGNCGECKDRIENSADIKGVKICSWNTETKVFSVTYKSDKVTIPQIQKAIAARGYDAGDVKGNDVAYNKLPGCCQYRTGKCEEPKKK